MTVGERCATLAGLLAIMFVLGVLTGLHTSGKLGAFISLLD